MISQHDKAKRWRPRFSIRTLAILITLVCCYAACWAPTKKWGVEDVIGHAGFWVKQPKGGDGELMWPNADLVWPAATSASMPLVVRMDDFDGNSRYYFWFFGYVAKLPYEGVVDFETSDFLSLPRPSFD